MTPVRGLALLGVISFVGAVYVLGQQHTNAQRDLEAARDHIETLERIEDALDDASDLPWHERLQLERERRGH